MDDAVRVRDEWIALRCQSGEPSGFEDLVAELERPLLYYATKLTGDLETALECVQDVWVKVFRDIKSLKDPGSLRPWLYRITHGIAVDRIRHDVSRERAEAAHGEAFDEAMEPSFAALDASVLHDALAEIEFKHREVLVLHFLEDFSLIEIAQVLGCSEGTVKSRLHYAKKAVRGVLVRGGYGKTK